MEQTNKWTPATNKIWLHLTAGIIWSGVGITLRRYSPIPKPILAILYPGLGASLFASSLQYFLQVIRSANTVASSVQSREFRIGQFFIRT